MTHRGIVLRKLLQTGDRESPLHNNANIGGLTVERTVFKNKKALNVLRSLKGVWGKAFF